MKINHAHTSWAKYSKTITDFVSSKGRNKELLHGYKKLRPLNQFVSWPSCPKRRVSALCGYTLPPELDLKPVGQFLKRHTSLSRTEPLLRNSPLLSHAPDAWHGPALEKAVAIKRMASLLHETLSAMKSLTHIQISQHRG